MKLSKKVTVIGLATVLVLVIAGGIAALVHFSGGKEAPPSTAVSASPTVAPLDGPTAKPTVRYRETSREDIEEVAEKSNNFFVKSGGAPLLCVSTIEGETVIRTLTRLSDGSAEREISFDYGTLVAYCLDAQSNLWMAEYDDALSQIFVSAHDAQGNEVGPKTVLEGVRLEEQFPWGAIKKLMVDSAYIYALYQDGNWNNLLQVFDHSGTMLYSVKDVDDFDIDNSGNFFAILTSNQKLFLEKHSAEKNTVLWTKELLRSKLAYNLVWYTPKTDRVYAMTEVVTGYSAEKGDEKRELMKLGADTTFTLDEIRMGRDADTKKIAAFAVDEQENIYFLQSWSEIVSEDPYFVKRPGILSQYAPRTETATEYDLTLTLPYKQDFIVDAVRRYEAANPGKHILLDAAYATRDEFRPNVTSYAQQLTLRILSNDVGDIVMTAGAGLDSEALYRTDAFVDLEPYLKGDAISDSLNWNILDAARVDGNLRGLPTSAYFPYYQWNASLAKEMGITQNGSEIRWSDLLTIAEQWNAEGVDAFLLSGADSVKGGPVSGTDDYLYDLVFSNIWDMVDAKNKTVNLKQEWFLDLLRRWKDLQGTPCFIHPVSEKDWGFLTDLTPSVLVGKGLSEAESVNYANKSGWYMLDQERKGVSLELVPSVAGEKNTNRIACTINQYSISNTSQNKDAAWDFLRFLLEADIQKLDSLNGVAVNREADAARLEHALKSGNEISTDYYDMMQPVYDSPDHLYEPYLFNQAIMPPLYDYMDDKLTLDEAITQAEQNLLRRLNE